MGNGEEMCAVCFSPLQRNGGKGISRWDFFGEALEKEELRARGDDEKDDGGKGDGPIVTRNGQTRRETENEHLREKERVADPKRELFTTACNHVFHKCCLVECRVRDFSTCPMCRGTYCVSQIPDDCFTEAGDCCPYIEIYKTDTFLAKRKKPRYPRG